MYAYISASISTFGNLSLVLIRLPGLERKCGALTHLQALVHARKSLDDVGTFEGCGMPWPCELVFSTTSEKEGCAHVIVSATHILGIILRSL
jgi:hypothetical protein